MHPTLTCAIALATTTLSHARLGSGPAVTGVSELGPAISLVASEYSFKLDHLQRADEMTAERLAKFSDSLTKSLSTVGSLADIDVILCGSFGRREVTSESDYDYLVLVGADADHRAMQAVNLAVSSVVKTLKGPGSTGLFGDFSITTELYSRIGLESDSYTNATRRMLLLTESVSALSMPFREESIRRIADRYCDDYVDLTADSVPPVPRFFLNDIFRYWRTLTVDYAAKQWKDGRESSSLRKVKLLTSRKLLFAGSLASAFLTQTLPSSSSPHDSLVEYLVTESNRTPLNRLMSLYPHVSSSGRNALAKVLRRYDEFIGILNDRGSRITISSAYSPSTDESAALKVQVDEICDDIQAGLQEVFFNDPWLSPLTVKYGLF